MRLDGFTLRISRSATAQSCASPPVNTMSMRTVLSAVRVGSLRETETQGDDRHRRRHSAFTGILR